MELAAARAFLEEEGLVLESAKGPRPSLAERIAGEPIRGSWWGHPAGHTIFAVLERLREDPDVVVLRLVRGKLTYVHRRLWPALARLAGELHPRQLAKVVSVHTERGHHEVRELPFEEWLPDAERLAAAALSESDARALLRAALE